MNLIKLMTCVATVVTMAACSGGGGSSGSVPNATQATGTTTTSPITPIGSTVNVTSFVFSLEKPSIANNGVDQSKFTVVALDANNNVVPGAVVSVSANNNSIVVPPAKNTTDVSGSYEGIVKSGADKSNRIINIIATINGVSKSLGLQVQGSQLAVTIVPAGATPGQSVTLTVNAKDANNVGVNGVNVNVSGAVTTALTTDFNGNASVVFAAPSTPGTYNLNALGLGVQAVSSLVVGSSGGGGIPPAVIPSGVVPSFAINPTVLSPNTPGSSANQANFRFLILDPANNPIPNVRVRFEKNGTGLGYDGRITTGANTVSTNASGIATGAYIAGIETSPTNGVSFKACYKATDFTSSADCPNSVVANMTVAGSAVNISIGDDGALTKSTGVYTQRFAVSVVDSAGRAVVGALVAPSVDITHYGKGLYSQTRTLSVSSSAIGFAIPDVVTTPAVFGAQVSCPNEDTNRSGSVDPSEDINNNGIIDPKASDVSIAPDSPGILTTDSNGIVLLKVTWLQKVATWLVYRVKVTTSVSGSESRAESSFPTYFVVGDDAFAAPFKVPPYGTGACNQNN
jgi:hypothetical protein